MKHSVMLTVLALALGVSAQQLSLSDARAKIAEAIADPTLMALTVQQLAAADQTAYLADVNEAIGKMPGSAEVKAAAFLDANRAALKGAQKGQVADVLAEVFATASLESLTIINEQFASDLFNRAADPSVTYTDEQFVKLAKDTLKKIAERNAKVDDGSVRTGFAILMFVRASNGSPKDLASTLAEVLPEKDRDLATKEWFPAALAEGDAKSYDPMLGGSESPIPNAPVACRLAHPQSLEALLADLAAGGKEQTNLKMLNALTYGSDHGGMDQGLDNGLYRLPFTYDVTKIGTKTYTYIDPVTGEKKTITVTSEAGQKGSGRKIGGGSKVPGIPGGVPVGPGGKPVAPGGQEIEPGGYPDQD